MTGRYEDQPLRGCPPGTLAALRAQVAVLLRFGDLLPADLYVKLDLLREDLSAAIRPSPALRAPSFTPHAAAAARELPASRRDGLSPGRARDAS